MPFEWMVKAIDIFFNSELNIYKRSFSFKAHFITEKTRQEGKSG